MLVAGNAGFRETGKGQPSPLSQSRRRGENQPATGAQNVKPYQVKQVRAVILKYKLGDVE
jgi:hypothetical protein